MIVFPVFQYRKRNPISGFPLKNDNQFPAAALTPAILPYLREAPIARPQLGYSSLNRSVNATSPAA